MAGGFIPEPWAASAGIRKEVVREALVEMQEIIEGYGFTEDDDYELGLLDQAFYMEVREAFDCIDEAAEPYEDLVQLHEMAAEGIPHTEGLRILKRAKCAALAQMLEGYRVQDLGEDFRLAKKVRQKQSDSQEDDSTDDGSGDGDGDQRAGKQDPGGPTGQEPNDTQPGSPEDDKTGNSDDQFRSRNGTPDTGSGPADPEEDLNNDEDPIDGHNATPIDLQPILARSVDDGIIGEGKFGKVRMLAFYENISTALVEFEDGHLQVVTENQSYDYQDEDHPEHD
jgi:hypothetical protein